MSANNFHSLLNSFKQNTASVASSSAASAAAPSALSRPQWSSKKRLRDEAKPKPKKFSVPPAILTSSFELSFLVIGGQKCGTSWLNNLLRKCHSISLPPNEKEVHFWDWHYRRGYDWYIEQFDFPGSSGSNSSASKPFYGEITPCYVVLPSEKIEEISRIFPKLKLVFIARELVGRAWSALIMELRNQTSGLDAGAFADGSGIQTCRNERDPKKSKTSMMSFAQKRRIQELSSPSSQPDSYYMERLRNSSHDSRSNYGKHLKNWYEFFPPENILIVDYREIDSDPRGTLSKIVRHIGLDEEEARVYVESLDDRVLRQRVNAATNDQLSIDDSTAAIKTSVTSSDHVLNQRPHLKRQMQKYLQPYAVEFNALLEEKGYSWRLDEYDSEG
ncbi:hypothetical protein ACHAXS_001292 [Conticribra weissflogii]